MSLAGMGLTEASDPMCCEGSVYLLKVQHKNGSFPLWFGEPAFLFPIYIIILFIYTTLVIKSSIHK